MGLFFNEVRAIYFGSFVVIGLFTRLSNQEDARKQLGLFIIATNDLREELTMEQLLTHYKSQQSVEKGLRFLKSPTA